MDSAKRIISGTWGEVWLDGEYVSECYGMQAKVSANKERVSIPRQMAQDTKTTYLTMTGSVRLHKVSSRMARLMGDGIKAGRDPRFTLITKLADPDSYGAERIEVRNVSFDDLTLADWEVGALGKIECPFTFTDYKYLDEIGG